MRVFIVLVKLDGTNESVVSLFKTDGRDITFDFSQPLRFGASVFWTGCGEYTRKRKRLQMAVAVGWGATVPCCGKPSAGFNELLVW